MAPKRILYLCADRGIPIGGTKGASIHVREFCDALPEIGYEPIIAAARFEPNGNYQPGCQVYPLPISSDPEFVTATDELVPDKQTLREARDYYRNDEIEKVIEEIYERVGFELIYERYSLFCTAGQVFASKNHIPHVLEVNAPLVLEAGRYRNLSQEPLARTVERFLFRKVDHIISVSEKLKEYIHQKAPLSEVTVIPNGVSMERFNSTDGNGWKDRISGSDSFLVGFVGAVKPWHGVDILIKAIERLAARDNKIHLCIVGNGDEAYEAELRRLTSSMNLADRITFLGMVPFEDIPAVLDVFDLVIAPYPKIDNFYFSPLKIFEYMAAGKPIIASAIGQIPDIITDGDNGLLIPPGNMEALAEAIKRLYNEPEFARRLGRNAFEEVKSSHTWSQRMVTVDEILQGSMKLKGREVT